MAINTWINVTLDPSAASIADNQNMLNTAVGGTTTGASLSIAYDSAKITSVSLALSCIESAKRALLARLPQ